VRAKRKEGGGDDDKINNIVGARGEERKTTTTTTTESCCQSFLLGTTEFSPSALFVVCTEGASITDLTPTRQQSGLSNKIHERHAREAHAA